MADAGWTKRLGATPGKLAAVALLAMVLVAVVLLQGSNSSAPANTSQEPNAASGRSQTASEGRQPLGFSDFTKASPTPGASRPPLADMRAPPAHHAGLDSSDVGQEPRLPEKASPKVSVAQPSAPDSDAPRRPEVSLEETSQHDPFALVSALAELVAAQSSESKRTKSPHGQAEERNQRIKQAIAALRTKGVQMVLLGKEETLAIVGDRSVRVGDVLDGLRVISITPQGITLSDQDDQSP